jgi:hypothetical protein
MSFQTQRVAGSNINLYRQRPTRTRCLQGATFVQNEPDRGAILAFFAIYVDMNLAEPRVQHPLVRVYDLNLSVPGRHAPIP